MKNIDIANRLKVIYNKVIPVPDTKLFIVGLISPYGYLYGLVHSSGNTITTPNYGAINAFYNKKDGHFLELIDALDKGVGRMSIYCYEKNLLLDLIKVMPFNVKRLYSSLVFYRELTFDNTSTTYSTDATLCDPSGQLISSNQYKYIKKGIADDLIVSLKSGSSNTKNSIINIIDRQENIKFSNIQLISRIDQKGLQAYKVYKNGKIGVVAYSGEIVIPFKYNNIDEGKDRVFHCYAEHTNEYTNKETILHDTIQLKESQFYKEYTGVNTD